MKISEKINFDNTIFVLTADHGERIPFGEKSSFQFEPEFKQVSKIGKKILPKAVHNTGGKIMGKFKKNIAKSRVDYSNKDLSSSLMRCFKSSSTIQFDIKYNNRCFST